MNDFCSQLYVDFQPPHNQAQNQRLLARFDLSFNKKKQITEASTARQEDIQQCKPISKNNHQRTSTILAWPVSDFRIQYQKRAAKFLGLRVLKKVRAVASVCGASPTKSYYQSLWFVAREYSLRRHGEGGYGKFGWSLAA